MMMLWTERTSLVLRMTGQVCQYQGRPELERASGEACVRMSRPELAFGAAGDRLILQLRNFEEVPLEGESGYEGVDKPAWWLYTAAEC